MKVLCCETIPANPHVETSAEIALTYKKKNFDVLFAYLGSDLPWTDWDLKLIYRVFGASYEKKIDKLIEILEKKNIESFKFVKCKSEVLKKINNWSLKFYGNLDKLKHYKYKNFPLGYGVASSLISLHEDDNFNTIKNIKLVRRLLVSSAIVLERFKQLVEQEKPNIIVTFNNRFATSLPIVLYAKYKKIKILCHERGSNYKKYEIYETDVHNVDNTQKEILKYWKNANKNKIKIAKNFFKKRKEGKKINIYTSKSFTKNQKKGLKLYKSKNKRRVVYYTARDAELSSLYFQKFNQEKKFKLLVKACNQYKDIELIVRVHPSANNFKTKDDLRWQKYSNLKNVKIIYSKDPVNSYELMKTADIVATYTSTIIVESAYWGKPSISLGNFYYSKQKVAIHPKNYRHLVRILDKKYKFKKIKLSETYPYAFYMSTFGKKFKFYNPIDTHNGYLFNNLLTWKSGFIKMIIFFISNFKKIIAY